MSYVIGSLEAPSVNKAVIETTTFVNIPAQSHSNAWVSIFHATVDLTDIDTFHYGAKPVGDNGDIRFDYGGTTDDSPLADGDINTGTSDASSYTGQVELKIQIKTDSARTVNDIYVYATKT